MIRPPNVGYASNSNHIFRSSDFEKMSKRKSTGCICPKERKMRKEQKQSRLSVKDLLHSPGALIHVDDYDKYMKTNTRVITFERGSK